jgi:hypothetical protein
MRPNYKFKSRRKPGRDRSQIREYIEKGGGIEKFRVIQILAVEREKEKEEIWNLSHS